MIKKLLVRLPILVIILVMPYAAYCESHRLGVGAVIALTLLWIGIEKDMYDNKDSWHPI